jgi:hypothetical protein
VSDNRKDSGPAGCAEGCAKTMSGAALIMLLAVTIAVRLRRGGRRG